MARKVILGTDIARDAFKVKVNENFTELYDKDVALGEQINTLANQTHFINTTDNPQTIFNNGVAGDKFIFVKGEHIHNPINNNAILFVDKPCIIEIADGSVLKVANNSALYNSTAEIIKNFSSVVIGLDDLSVAGAFTETTGVAYAIQIDSTGATDTFKWSRVYNGDSTVWQSTNIPITGALQDIELGIQIKFNAVTGHTLNSLWLVCYGVNPYYGIRVGTGFQESYIDGVEIIGKGTINLNKNNQYLHNEYTKFLPACVQINGRVSNSLIDGIKMINAPRPIQVYGEHTGVYNLDGTTTGGTSYDTKNIVVKNTKIKDCSVGHIFGFPEHRGKVRNVTFYGNSSENTLPLVELNHGLENYNFQNNFAKSDGIKPLFSLWRHSKNGTIANNFMYDELGRTVNIISISTPTSWARPEGLIAYNNLNIDTFANGEHALALIMSNKATGLRSIALGGLNNIASNNYATILGGSGNTASGDTSGVLTGLNNIVSGAYSAVLVGASNSVLGSHNSVLNGANNNVDGTYNEVSGSGNSVSGTNNCVSGKNHIVNKNYTNSNGLEGITDWTGENVFASGKFTVVGDAKTSKLVCKGRSTSATFVQLLSNATEIVIPLHTTLAYKITVVATNEDDTQQGMWVAQGIVTRASGDVALKGNTVTKVYSDSVTWDFQAVAYTPSQSINLKAHGDAGQNVRWVATVELTVVKTQ